MAHTFKRQPLSVSTSSKDYPKEQVLAQIGFKGICDIENDLGTNQSSFSDAVNVYIDENNVLVSRPPFIKGTTENILQTWSFGEIVFLFRKEIVDTSGAQVPDPLSEDKEELVFKYIIVAQTNSGEYSIDWQIPFVDMTTDEPEIFATQIEEKIFFWFARTDLVAFDTTEFGFEDAQEYLYVPTTELILNNLQYEYEDVNFLTDSYKRRYEYSALSSLNYDDLIGKSLEVNLTTDEGAIKHLYDIEWQKNSEKTLLFPKSIIGRNYHIDVVHTPRATVILRYGALTKRIEISFDGKYFRTIPTLDGIIGNPIFTKDGLYLIAFTASAIYKYKLVAQESTDFAGDTEFDWEPFPYMQYAISNHEYVTISAIDETYSPIGNFSTIDQFSYVFKSDGYKYLYTQWQNSQRIFAGYHRLTDDNLYPSQNATLITKYVPDSVFSGTAMLNALIEQGAGTGTGRYHLYNFEGRSDLQSTVYNGDTIFFDGNIRYIYKLTSDHKFIVNEKVAIIDGDAVLLIDEPKDTTSQVYVFTNGKMYYRTTTYKENALLSNNEKFRWVVNNGTNGVLRYGEEVIFEPLSTELTYTGYDIAAISGVIDESELEAFFIYEADDDDIIMLDPGDTRLHHTVSIIGDGTEQEIVLFSDKFEANTEKSVLSTPFNTPYSIADVKVAGYISSPIRDQSTMKYNLYFATRDTSYGTSYDLFVSVPKIWDTEKNSISTISQPLWSVIDRSTETDKFIVDENTGDFAANHYIYTDGEKKNLPVLLTNKDSVPLCISDNIVYYLIDDELWSTEIDANIILDLDEYVNCDGKRAILNEEMPTCMKTLAEHYFSFEGVNGKHLLEITSTRRKDVTDDYDFLLYLPRSNEQVFPNKITNLCPLSENTMGIFDADGVWYMSSITSESDILYTKPAKSKIPIGCRDGDDVVIALDGQALLVPTPRGITAIRPELLTTGVEQTVSYLSDMIQNTWWKYYPGFIEILSEARYQKPQIKIQTMKYIVLFYKQYDREILLFDTRDNSWWRWITPYPIRQFVSESELLFQIDPYPAGSNTYTFDEVKILTSHYGCLYSIGTSEQYCDDIVQNTVRGDFEEVETGQKSGNKYIRWFMANGIINWHITSQRLHFGQINNYKQIKGLNLDLSGDTVSTAKLSTKVFRDNYHPEQFNVFEIKVNEVKTFIMPMNLMHTIKFQYKLENDTSLSPTPLRLNSVCIKYEVKEKIR